MSTLAVSIVNFGYVVQWVFLLYCLGITSIYLSLNVLAFYAMRRERSARAQALLPRYTAGMEPGISLIVPAYNEEGVIVASTRSLLQLDYPTYEVVVINDGSKDKTLELMLAEFDMVPYPEAYHVAIAVQPVKGVYRSRRYPMLKLVDKANGGKADAMNAGINAAQHPLVCVVDADSLLERNSLHNVVRPFLEDRRTVASGGTIRIANGCTIQDGYIKKVAMPDNWIARMQVVEYLRAFLFGRLGWTPINAMLIISGAFGVFRRQAMIDIKGFDAKTIGEDMELVTRMHRYYKSQGKEYRIAYVPEAVCWTEAPEDIKVLGSQRVRWQRGLLEVLWTHRQMLFAKGSGSVGWVSLPIFLIFEGLGPLIELVGLISLVGLLAVGAMSASAMLAITLLVFALGVILSSSALLLEILNFNAYPRRRDLFMMLATVVVENFGYRQINSWWRIKGCYMWLRKRPQVWGNMTRKGLGT